jgi:hypothetical protein
MGQTLTPKKEGLQRLFHPAFSKPVSMPAPISSASRNPWKDQSGLVTSSLAQPVGGKRVQEKERDNIRDQYTNKGAEGSETPEKERMPIPAQDGPWSSRLATPGGRRVRLVSRVGFPVVLVQPIQPDNKLAVLIHENVGEPHEGHFIGRTVYTFLAALVFFLQAPCLVLAALVTRLAATAAAAILLARRPGEGQATGRAQSSARPLQGTQEFGSRGRGGRVHVASRE